MGYSTLILWISFVWTSIHVLHLLLKKRSTKTNLPPGPIPLPVVGSLFKLGDRPNESLAQLAKIYGPIMSLKLGNITTVVASSANMAKEVLQKKDQACSGRTVIDAARVFKPEQASFVWSPVNTHWRTLRMISTTQIFTNQRLESNQSLRRQKVQDLITYVARNCKEGVAVDIGKAAFTCILNLLSGTIFSMDLVYPDSESAQEFKDLIWGMMVEGGKPNLGDYFPLIRPLDLQGIRRRMTVHFRKLHMVFERLIEERLLARAASDSSSRMNDFLDVLLDHKEDTDPEFDMIPVLVELFAAGSDTSTNTVEWAMSELLHNADAMARARHEIAQTISAGHTIEESDISRLPYLQAIVKETLRLHPPVPLLIPHRAESDVEICGYTIPKHAQVLVNVWAISRDADMWPDPTDFKPERFLGCEIDFRGRDFKLIPFGAGRRICPGLPLASRMVHLMLASLLHSFSWKLPDGMTPRDMDMRDKFGVTLQRAVPLRAIPVRD